jgi:hypothetical protein
MDELEYHRTYQSVNDQPCIFAKALLSRCCQCDVSLKLNLAEREAMSCIRRESYLRCEQVFEHLRRNAKFALHLVENKAPLRHADGMKMQCGGLRGIMQVLAEDTEKTVRDTVDNVDAILTQVLEQYNDFADLPYPRVIRHITSYKLKKRSRRQR